MWNCFLHLQIAFSVNIQKKKNPSENESGDRKRGWEWGQNGASFPNDCQIVRLCDDNDL